MGTEISTGIIVVALIIALVCAIKSYVKKLRYGCCGSGDGKDVKKIRITDKDTAHYPHVTVLDIDGMTCGNCAARVENALNSLDGVWAKVDLSQKQAVVRMKEAVDENELRRAVNTTGYTVMKITKKS